MRIEQLRRTKAREIFEELKRQGGAMKYDDFVALAVSKGYKKETAEWKIKYHWQPNLKIIYVANQGEEKYVILTEDTHTCSFGIEMETGFVSPTGIVSYAPSPYYCVEKFTPQNDITAGTEIRTPILTDIHDAVAKISEQWRVWSQQNRGLSPFFKCEKYHPSMGNHIHIGLPDRSLTFEQKKQIASYLIPVYPLLMGISSNTRGMRGGKHYESRRMAYSSYCYALRTQPIYSEHYYEISDSHNGTVEFRSFDSNIPQVSLTCAFVLKKGAEIALSHNEVGISHEFTNFKTYRQERKKVVEKGLMGLYMPEYKHILIERIGNIKLKELPNSIKEVLFMAIAKKMSVSSFIPKYTYHFNKIMAHNVEELFTNILQIEVPVSKKKIIEGWMAELQDKKYLSDIPCELGLEELTDYFVSSNANMKMFKEMVMGYKYDKSILPKLQEVVEADTEAEVNRIRLPKSVKKKLLLLNPKFKDAVLEEQLHTKYVVGRLKTVGMDYFAVAKQISEILKQNGVELTTDEIISAITRFCVFIFDNQVLGVVGVNVPDRKIDYPLIIKEGYEKYKEFITEKLYEFVYSTCGIRCD